MTSSEFYICYEHPMYVQRWGPPKDGSPRVVLIHGGVHTGVCWTVLMISLAGRNIWRSEYGLLSLLIGRG